MYSMCTQYLTVLTAQACIGKPYRLQCRDQQSMTAVGLYVTMLYVISYAGIGTASTQQCDCPAAECMA